MYEKVLGVLLGAAVGDAMGAATELRTPKEILETFGHWVTDFETPPADVFAGGRKAGQITDDFSSAYFTIRAILAANGEITPQVAQAGILSWAESEYYESFCGSYYPGCGGRDQKKRRIAGANPVKPLWQGNQRGRHEGFCRCGFYSSRIGRQLLMPPFLLRK